MKSTKRILLLTLIFSVKESYSLRITDSLEIVLSSQVNEEEKAFTLFTLIKTSNPKDIDKRELHLNLLNKIIANTNDDSLKSFFSYKLGNLFYVENNFYKSISYFNQAYHIYKNTDHYKSSEILGKIGRVYYSQGNYVKALETYYDALKIYEDYKIINKDYGWLLRYIGSVFKRQGDYESALEYYQKALLIFEEVNYPDGISSSYNNLGIVYGFLGEESLELDYYQKALKISRESKQVSRVPVILSNIGQKLQDKGEYKGALDHYNEAFKLYQKENRYSFMASNVSAIGNIYFQQKKYKQAITQYKRAEKYAFQSDKKRIIRLENIYSNLSWVYDSLGHSKEALRYYKLYKAFNDSLDSKESITKIASMHSNFEAAKEKEKLKRLALEKKVVDQELSLSKQQEKITSYTILTIIGFSLLTIVFFIILFFRRAKTQKKNAVINELKQQMAKIEKGQLEKKLNLKNRDLTNFALDIARKKEFIEEMLEKLSLIPSSENTNEIKALIQFVRGQRDIDKTLNLLYENVEVVNSAFFDSLLKKYPLLTKNERLLCGLIRISLSNKEICMIRNITPKAVKMGKYRLKKSLNLRPEESLDRFLQEF